MRSTEIIWPETVNEARKIQQILRTEVKITPLKTEPRYIAGADAAFSDDRIMASVCLFKYPEISLVEFTYAEKEIIFPYIPGFLSFREGPAIIKALTRLKRNPDLVIFDGHGIAHPQRLGIASHLGVLLDLPTIGCAKSRLIGDFTEPDITKGSSSPLLHKGKKIGIVLRTRDRVRPVFLSPGHMINLKHSFKIISTCIGKYRIPEPLRCADSLPRKVLKFH